MIPAACFKRKGDCLLAVLLLIALVLILVLLVLVAIILIAVLVVLIVLAVVLHKDTSFHSFEYGW